MISRVIIMNLDMKGRFFTIPGSAQHGHEEPFWLGPKAFSKDRFDSFFKISFPWLAFSCSWTLTQQYFVTRPRRARQPASSSGWFFVFPFPLCVDCGSAIVPQFLHDYPDYMIEGWILFDVGHLYFSQSAVVWCPKYSKINSRFARFAVYESFFATSSASSSSGMTLSNSLDVTIRAPFAKWNIARCWMRNRLGFLWRMTFPWDARAAKSV